MNISEIISQLDALREKTEPQEWVSDHFDDENVYFGTSEEDVGACFDDESQGTDNAEYIIALHNCYEALRQAALDGERYREAGEALAEAIDKSKKDSEWCADCLARIDCEEALTAYRTACGEAK